MSNPIEGDAFSVRRAVCALPREPQVGVRYAVRLRSAAATPELRAIDAFLLSREWRDTGSGVEIVLWARAEEAPVRARFSRQEAVMFVPRGSSARADRRAARPLVTLRGGGPVDAVYFQSQRALVLERERIRGAGGVALESDVKPADRFLMERFVTGAVHLRGAGRLQGGVLHFDDPTIKTADVRPLLRVLSLDVETDGLGGRFSLRRSRRTRRSASSSGAPG